MDNRETLIEQAGDFAKRFVYEARPATIQSETESQAFFDNLIPTLMADFAAKIRDEAVAAERKRHLEMVKDVRDVYIEYFPGSTATTC